MRPVDKNDRRRWPRCAVCRRPVAKCQVVRLASGLGFRVWCHGQQQVEFVPADVYGKIQDAGDELVFAEAFHAGGEPLLTTRRGFGVVHRGPHVSMN